MDCGSNAIRAAIADPAPGATKVVRRRLPVRLGTDVFEAGRVREDTAARFLGAMDEIAAWFASEGVSAHRAVATSALRNAANGEALCRQAHRRGIELEAISGATEADLVRRAVLATGARPTVIADLGGGSLEVQLLREGQRVGGEVFPVGTVRLGVEEDAMGRIAPRRARRIRRRILDLLDGLPTHTGTGVELVLCGGNAKALAKLFSAGRRRRGQPRILDLEAMRDGLAALVDGTTGERIAAYGVRRDRAEVIGAAAVVFEAVATWAGAERATVPGVGVLDGLLLGQQTRFDRGIPAVSTTTGAAAVLC